MSKEVIIVTGTYRGIGKAIAEYLTSEGHQVIGLDIKANNGKFQQLVCDLRNWDEISKSINSICNDGTKVSGLVNNAAIQIEKNMLNTTMVDLENIFKTNVFSIYSLITSLSTHFNKTASIVNISSVHSFATSKNLSAYVATKGAISALTRSMALELGEKGIRVNSVSPGAIDTEMLQQGLSRNNSPEVALKKLKASSPLNKIGEPEDIAKMVSFLLNPTLSGNITGQEFIIDSGVLARLPSE